VETLVLTEREIRSLVHPDAARSAVRAAFVSLTEGKAVLPAPLGFQLPDVNGEMHAKGAYISGFPYFSVKVVTGFYGNRELGLPVLGGLVLVFDARTGSLRAILLDNGYLTDLRTAATGALAAEALSREDARTLAVLGAGGQARYQVEALLRVRGIEGLRVWSRTPSRARTYADEMRGRFGIEAAVCPNAREAVGGADIVVTVTPATEPLLEAQWLAPGVHVTAVGSDFPSKQELAVDVLTLADKYVADSIVRCAEAGELHHAVDAGAMTTDDVHAELGEILAGRKPGRQSSAEITVADLTGLGVEDAAMGTLTVTTAEERGMGRTISTG
jgi:ornithine cyclodeaminase